MKPILGLLICVLACGSGTMPRSSLPQSAPERVQPQLAFIDEAAQEPSLERFRSGLIDAVKKRDAKRVLQVSAPEIQKRFMSGLALPRDAFKPQVYEDSEWKELETVLSLGGSFTTRRGAIQGRREFCAPYVYSAYPEPINVIVEKMAGHNENPESDPWVVVGTKVPVHENPSGDSRVLTYLSHSLVIPTRTESPGSPPAQWLGVYLPQRKVGWIRADKLRSPDDYHACFANISGEWKLVLFERS